jgi:peptidyl-prolyl cis-trans isomerase D
MIVERLVTNRARDFGYRVSEQQLGETIAQIPAFQVDGKYDARVAKARLASQGMTPAGFESEVRLGLQREQVLNALRVSNFLTRAESERLFALENEQREVRYTVLAPEKFATPAQVSAAAIAAYYADHQALYMNPESARVTYAELRLDQLAAQVQVTDEQLRAAYEKSKAHFVTQEKRRARHILLQVTNPKDDAAALAKAQQVLAEARAGKDFSALARQYSQDSGSAAQGGDLGWAERSYFVAPFADALFGMKQGEIRGPVKTQFGYHLIVLDGIQAGAAKSFAEARPEIEAQLRRDQAADLFGDRQEQLQRKLEQPGAELNALVAEFGLKTGEVADFQRGAGGAPLGSSTELQDVVFSPLVAGQGHLGGPVALGEDRMVIVKVSDHHPSAPKPLAEVRAQVAAAVAKQQGTAAATAAAVAALKRVRTGETLESVAQAIGAKVEPARFVGRADPSLPAQIRGQVFDSPRPAPGKPVSFSLTLESGGAAIVAVTAVRTDDPQENLALRAKRLQDMTMRGGENDAAAYVAELRRRAKVEKNPKAFE